MKRSAKAQVYTQTTSQEQNQITPFVPENFEMNFVCRPDESVTGGVYMGRIFIASQQKNASQAMVI